MGKVLMTDESGSDDGKGINSETILSPKVEINDVVTNELQPPISISGPSDLSTIISGTLVSVSSYNFVDTVKTTVDKILNRELFKIYPNPVVKSQTINLGFKNSGHFEIQVFDNNGKFYLQNEVEIGNNVKSYLFVLPKGLIAGVYFIKAIDTKSKKQFIDKLIVQ